MNDLEQYLEERDRIVEALDIAGYRRLGAEWGFPVSRDDRVALIALHKSRSGITSLPRDIRLASDSWLKERGYTSFYE